jgi:hypothetical protein
MPMSLFHLFSVENSKMIAATFKYSQTWTNDHLRITTTCTQRLPFWSPNLSRCNKRYLWTTITCQQRSQIWGPEGGRCTRVWLYNLVGTCKYDYTYFRSYIFGMNNVEQKTGNNSQRIIFEALLIKRDKYFVDNRT